MGFSDANPSFWTVLEANIWAIGIRGSAFIYFLFIYFDLTLSLYHVYHQLANMAAQWRPGQQGFQYPMQTGYPGNPQLQQNSQFQPQQPQFQPQNPQFQPQQQFQSGGLGLPTGGMLSQPTGFIGGSPGGLLPQPTGYIGSNMSPSGMLPQPTGYIGGNIPYGAGGVPQLPQQQQSLFPSMAQPNQQQHSAPTQQLSWALSKAEKKKYNDTFRLWDPQNTHYIDGPTALSVFRDTGLPQNDLARIW